MSNLTSFTTIIPIWKCFVNRSLLFQKNRKISVSKRKKKVRFYAPFSHSVDRPCAGGADLNWFDFIWLLIWIGRSYPWKSQSLKLHLYFRYNLFLFFFLLVSRMGTNNERNIFGLPLKSKKYIRRVLTFFDLWFIMEL